MSEKKWYDSNRIISSKLMTDHAIMRIKTRLVGIITVQEVEDMVNKFRPKLSELSEYEQVIIVIKN